MRLFDDQGVEGKMRNRRRYEDKKGLKEEVGWEGPKEEGGGTAEEERGEIPSYRGSQEGRVYQDFISSNHRTFHYGISWIKMSKTPLTGGTLSKSYILQIWGKYDKKRKSKCEYNIISYDFFPCKSTLWKENIPKSKVFKIFNKFYKTYTYK